VNGQIFLLAQKLKFPNDRFSGFNDAIADANYFG